MRWRPPTRPLILIALLLLAGAVVNVGVAWGIVWRMGHAATEWGNGSPPAFHVAPDAMTDGHQFLNSKWRSARRRHLEPAPGGWWSVQEIHWYRPKFEHVDYSPQVSRGTTAAGWPFLSLRVSYDIGAFGQRDAIAGAAGGIAAPARFVDRSFLRTTGGRLPIDPLARGFLVNTVFYSAALLPILALPLSFFPIRRRLRARRGRCPKCGYDLAELGGAEAGAEGAAPCPECGATR